MKECYETLYDAFLKTHIRDYIPGSTKKNIPVYEDKSDDNSTVRTATLPFKEDSDIKLISKNDFQKAEAKKRNIAEYIWSKPPLIKERVKKKFDDVMQTQEKPKANEDLVDFIENPKNLVALCHMGIFGWGLIATQLISKNSLVTLYGGIILSNRFYDEKSDYGINAIGDHSLFDAVTFDLKSKQMSFGYPIVSQPMIIDARQAGYYGSFAQHLPLPSEIPQSLRSSSIATANTEIVRAHYKNYPISLLRATIDIPKGALIGYCYTKDGSGEIFEYWKKRKISPTLFTQSGKLTLFKIHHTTNTLHKDFSIWDQAEAIKHSFWGFFSHSEISQIRFITKGVNEGIKKLVHEELCAGLTL